MNQQGKDILVSIQTQDLNGTFIDYLQNIDIETVKDIDKAMQQLKQSREKVNEQSVRQNKKILLLKGILKIAVVILLTTALLSFIGHLTESAISPPNTVIFFCIFVVLLTLYPIRKLNQLKSGIDHEISINKDIFDRLQKLRDVGFEENAQPAS